MSVENLKEYARRCAMEPELRDRAKAFGMTNVDEHMRQSESLGLDWTNGDLTAFRKEVVGADGDLEDLGEEELEQVAGGVVSTTVVVAIAVGAAVGGAVGAVATTAAVGGATAAGDGGW